MPRNYRTNYLFTPEMDDIIRKHWPNKQAKEIAEMLGCHPTSLSDRAIHRLGLPSKALPAKKAFHHPPKREPTKPVDARALLARPAWFEEGDSILKLMSAR